jgi:hypothetical protein
MNLPGRRPQGALLARAEPIPIEAPQTKARKQSQRRMERRGAIRESSFRLSVLLAPCVRHRRRPASEMIPCPRLGNGRSDRRFVIPELALHGVIFSRRASRASSCHRLSSLCPRCLSDRARCVGWRTVIRGRNPEDFHPPGLWQAAKLYPNNPLCLRAPPGNSLFARRLGEPSRRLSRPWLLIASSQLNMNAATVLGDFANATLTHYGSWCGPRGRTARCTIMKSPIPSASLRSSNI